MVEIITIDQEAFKIMDTISGYIIKVFPYGNTSITECSAETMNKRKRVMT